MSRRKMIGVALTIATIVTGCGDRFARNLGQAGYTVVGFSSPDRQAAEMNLIERFEDFVGVLSFMDAGLVVYAENADNPMYGGQRAIAGASAAGAVSWSIPNGRYRFFAVGYDVQSAGSMELNPACGLANGGHPIELRGGELTITIRTGPCAIPQFTGAIAGPEITGAQQVRICNSDPVGIGYADDCASFGGVDASFYSLQVLHPSFDHFGDDRAPFDATEYIHGHCRGTAGIFQLDSGNVSRVLQGTGNPEFRVGTLLRAFSSGSCTGAYQEWYFPFGIGAAGNGPMAPIAVRRPDGYQPMKAQWRFSGPNGKLYLNL